MLRGAHAGVTGCGRARGDRGRAAGAAWLLRPLPGGVWLGFALGKVAADLAWYGMEASARRGMARAAGRVPGPLRRRPGAAGRMLAPCTLTGPSCDSQDTVLDQVWLPLPQAGDRVLIGNAGAYTTCYSGRSAF